jgi:hypothetical protein
MQWFKLLKSHNANNNIPVYHFNKVEAIFIVFIIALNASRGRYGRDHMVVGFISIGLIILYCVYLYF